MLRTYWLALTAFLLPAGAFAQSLDMVCVPAQVDEAAIPLHGAYAPDADGGEIWTEVGTERWVRNVT